MVGLSHLTSQVCFSRSPCPWGRPLLTPASADTQTLNSRSGSVSVGSLGPGANKVFFELSKCFWLVWGLIVNAVSPLLLSCWGFSFGLGRGLSFFGGIQHSPIDGVQQWVAVLEFSQEKMSTRPSTLPSGLQIYWPWPCPAEQDPDSPTANPSHQKPFTSLLSSSIRGQTDWKPQKTHQTDHMVHSLV